MKTLKWLSIINCRQFLLIALLALVPMFGSGCATDRLYKYIEGPKSNLPAIEVRSPESIQGAWRIDEQSFIVSAGYWSSIDGREDSLDDLLFYKCKLDSQVNCSEKNNPKSFESGKHLASQDYVITADRLVFHSDADRLIKITDDAERKSCVIPYRIYEGYQSLNANGGWHLNINQSILCEQVENVGNNKSRSALHIVQGSFLTDFFDKNIKDNLGSATRDIIYDSGITVVNDAFTIEKCDSVASASHIRVESREIYITRFCLPPKRIAIPRLNYVYLVQIRRLGYVLMPVTVAFDIVFLPFEIMYLASIGNHP